MSLWKLHTIDSKEHAITTTQSNALDSETLTNAQFVLRHELKSDIHTLLLVVLVLDILLNYKFWFPIGWRCLKTDWCREQHSTDISKTAWIRLSVSWRTKQCGWLLIIQWRSILLVQQCTIVGQNQCMHVIMTVGCHHFFLKWMSRSVWFKITVWSFAGRPAHPWECK